MGLSMIRDFLDSILAWVNTPWRAVVAVLMLVLGGAAWATWSERGLLIRAVEQWLYGPELNEEAAEAGAKRLLAHADLVALYEVDLAANWKRTLYVFDRDGEITALEGMEMPFVPRSVDFGGRLRDALRPDRLHSARSRGVPGPDGLHLCLRSADPPRHRPDGRHHPPRLEGAPVAGGRRPGQGGHAAGSRAAGQVVGRCFRSATSRRPTRRPRRGASV